MKRTAIIVALVALVTPACAQEGYYGPYNYGNNWLGTPMERSPNTGAIYPWWTPPELNEPAPTPRPSPRVDYDKALQGAANLALYYNDCDKVPDAQVPFATRKILTTAVRVFGEDAIQNRMVQTTKERTALSRSVEDWCFAMKHLTDPRYIRGR
jgi:hypothetical protein